MKLFWLWFLIFMTDPVMAKDIPDPLAEWQDWVSYDQEFRNCPFFADVDSGSVNHHICAWPGQLHIQVEEHQAQFQINWHVIEDSWVVLPGDRSSWPQVVEVNHKVVTIQNNGNQPRVFLKAGQNQINGRFDWMSRPESITIPSTVASVKLELNGQAVKFPVIEQQALWLGETISDHQVEANNMDMKVSRLVIDGHPMTVFVAIDLEVSGVARNENLGRLLNADYRVTKVGGDLNAYIDQKGDLWAQLKPGYSEILVSMNVVGWPDVLTFNVIGDHWPNQEIWAYQDNKNIRLTQVEGVMPINPEQTASRWLEVPNFLLNQGDVFKITEQKRGTLNQSEQLTLNREAWLSFSGTTYRTKDQISGEKFGSWRLNASEGLQLLSAQSGDENLLITRSEQGQQGVELRKPIVNLVIDGEMDDQLLSEISGWDISFESVITKLYLPYGYMALAAFNVDSSHHVWLEQWRLWDIFIIMLVTVLSYQIIGWKSAILALVSLVLGYYEMNMPTYAWANLILSLALVAWVPRGRWLRFFQIYAVFSLLSLVVMLIPHWVSQARLSLHPQLANDRHIVYESSAVSKEAPSPLRLNKAYSQAYDYKNAIQDDIYPQVEEQVAKSKILGASQRVRRSDSLNRYQSDALLQAGKGTPQWNYNAVVLQWDGPITAEQSHRLLLISPWMRVIWRLLLIVASAGWLWTLVSRLKKLFSTRQLLKSTTALLWVCIVISPALYADTYPPNVLLEQLKERMFQSPECQPQCASIERAVVTVEGQQLSINLTYHALADVVVPIPDSADWQLTQVTIDGIPSNSRLRYADKQWIALNEGVAQIELRGYLATRNTVALRFPMSPGIVVTDSNDRQFAGLEGLQLTSSTLQLISTTEIDSHGIDQMKSTEVQSFVKLTRSIVFDDQWYITNTVRRLAPEQGVINVSLPLLQHEFPVEKIQVNEQGEVMVNLGPDEYEYTWRSRLERVNELTITAAKNVHYLEEWRLMAAPQWHMEITGIPLVAEESIFTESDDYFVHIYLPRPNESIDVNISRPDAVTGSVLSVDAIDNQYSVGKRTTKVVTQIRYRATQGGQFEVALDPEAIVKSVSFDGIESNLANENGVVKVGYLPGSHQVSIEWHVDQSLTMIHDTPTLELAGAYSNLNQTMTLPRDRWVLYGSSEGVGPAFLYWGELLVFVVLAVWLSRVRYSPLNIWQWLALGCAFGTFSWEAFTVIVVWLFFIGWRQQFKGFNNGRAKSILLQWFSLLFSIVALSVLISVMAYGLLSYPDMGVTGAQSTAYQLHWYLDEGVGGVPAITLFSLHLWWYKLLILLWSIWVSFALLNWLKVLFQSFQTDHWWPKFKRKKHNGEKN